MFFKKRNGYVGVDIGTQTVKLAQLQRCRSGYALSSYAVIPRRETMAIDHLSLGELQTSRNEIMVGRSLNGCFAGKTSAGTISMAACDMRSMSLGTSDPAQCRHRIAEQFDGIERFRSEPREFEFWPADAGAKESDVNVLSLPAKWAQQITEDQAIAGLECHVIDGVPQTLARAVELAYPNHSPIAFLDWGYSRATFGICSGGSPIFVRILRGSGIGESIQSLAKSFAITETQAEQLLRDTGIAPPDPEEDFQRPAGVRAPDSVDRKSETVKLSGSDRRKLQDLITETIAEPLNNVVQELKRTFEFLGARRSVPVPEQLLLFGGGAGLLNVGPWLTQRCELAVRPWECDVIKTKHDAPLEILGPAIALSMLAWKEHR